MVDFRGKGIKTVFNEFPAACQADDSIHVVGDAPEVLYRIPLVIAVGSCFREWREKTPVLFPGAEEAGLFVEDVFKVLRTVHVIAVSRGVAGSLADLRNGEVVNTVFQRHGSTVPMSVNRHVAIAHVIVQTDPSLVALALQIGRGDLLHHVLRSLEVEVARSHGIHGCYERERGITVHHAILHIVHAPVGIGAALFCIVEERLYHV